MNQTPEPLPTPYQPLQAYHLSHDLRGPLNSLLGFTELLLEGIEGPLNEIQIEDITAIRQSATNLLRLINAMVDLGKIDAGLLKLNLQPTGLKGIVASIQRSLPVQTEFIIAIPPAFPSLLADGKRVEQILFNLIEYLLVKNTAGSISITATPAESTANISISAPGVALSPEQLVILFEPLVQVEATGRSKLTEGGVYVPLAFKLARLHQGDLTVESTTETGTVFRLCLPLFNDD